MNVRTFFVGALLVAGALPLAGHLVTLRAGEHAVRLAPALAPQ